MRVIKFRAWDGSKMHRVGVIHWPFRSDDPTIVKAEGRPHDSRGDWPLIENPILMEFTGIVDRLNKEIFEGDIVLHRHHKNAPAVIEWVSDGWKVKVNTPKGIRWHEVYEGQSDDYGNGKLSWYEVIGNIYENPELVK